MCSWQRQSDFALSCKCLSFVTPLGITAPHSSFFIGFKAASGNVSGPDSSPGEERKARNDRRTIIILPCGNNQLAALYGVINQERQSSVASSTELPSSPAPPRGSAWPPFRNLRGAAPSAPLSTSMPTRSLRRRTPSTRSTTVPAAMSWMLPTRTGGRK